MDDLSLCLLSAVALGICRHLIEPIVAEGRLVDNTSRAHRRVVVGSGCLQQASLVVLIDDLSLCLLLINSTSGIYETASNRMSS